MAFDQFTAKRIELLTSQYIETRRPPHEIRDDIDLAFRIEDRSVLIFEIRSLWTDPSNKIEQMVARATFVASKKIWKIYWMRADLKWHSYEPLPEVKRFEEFIDAVEEDRFCCFWG
ncbi:MAG: DUF3024 domain-containing protein [Phycisphaerae bacterium]|jgi:hypothetical protein